MCLEKCLLVCLFLYFLVCFLLRGLFFATMSFICILQEQSVFCWHFKIIETKQHDHTSIRWSTFCAPIKEKSIRPQPYALSCLSIKLQSVHDGSERLLLPSSQDQLR